MSNRRSKKRGATSATMPWPTLLHQLVSEEVDDNWSAVIERCRTHPEEVGVQGAGYGQTALHVACYRYPPLAAIQAFLDACPDSAMLQNSDGETALHLASDGASEEVQMLLLRTRPGAISCRERHGDTPLHYAAAGGASTALLRAMVNADPSVASVPNARGETPLHLLGRTYERARTLDDVRPGTGDCADDWERAELLLRAAYLGEGTSENPSPLSSPRYGLRSDSPPAAPREAHLSLLNSGGGQRGDLNCLRSKPMPPNGGDLGGGSACSDDPSSAPSSLHDKLFRRPGGLPPDLLLMVQKRSQAPRRRRRVPVLHAAAGTNCPRALLRTAARLFPDQALERDELGRTPLLIAVEMDVHADFGVEQDDSSNIEAEGGVVGEGVDEGVQGGQDGEPGWPAHDEVGAGEVAQQQQHQQMIGGVPAEDIRIAAAAAAAAGQPPQGAEGGGAAGNDSWAPQRRLDLDAIHHQPEEEQEQDDDDEGPVRGSLRNQGQREPSVVDILIALTPRAASIADARGRLPLHIAVETGKTWDDGLRSLIWAAPRALETRDVLTHMYPFMIAATVADADVSGPRANPLDINPMSASLSVPSPMSASANSTAVITTVYELLRTLPELVAMGIPPEQHRAVFRAIEGSTELNGAARVPCEERPASRKGLGETPSGALSCGAACEVITAKPPAARAPTCAGPARSVPVSTNQERSAAKRPRDSSDGASDRGMADGAVFAAKPPPTHPGDEAAGGAAGPPVPSQLRHGHLGIGMGPIVATPQAADLGCGPPPLQMRVAGAGGATAVSGCMPLECHGASMLQDAKRPRCDGTVGSVQGRK